jgi:uncharacterized membrane protein YgdD (TMEM256/DUF423 family)
MTKLFLFLGSVNGFLAVALGAFGAHGLKGKLDPSMLTVFQTGVQYHLAHALALALVGVAAAWLPGSSSLRWAGWLFLAGIILFAGSLYALGITGHRWLGAITPFGGTAFLAGWVLLSIAALKA